MSTPSSIPHQLPTPQDIAFANLLQLYGPLKHFVNEYVGGAISNAKKEHCKNVTKGHKHEAACHPSCSRRHCPPPLAATKLRALPFVPQCTAQMACALPLLLLAPRLHSLTLSLPADIRQKQTGWTDWTGADRYADRGML